MVECDRCGDDREIKNSFALTGIREREHVEYYLNQICDRCTSKAIQFIEGNDALEEIPLEEIAKTTDEGDN